MTIEIEKSFTEIKKRQLCIFFLVTVLIALFSRVDLFGYEKFGIFQRNHSITITERSMLR